MDFRYTKEQNDIRMAAQEVTDAAVQLHGGYGYFEEMKVAMAYRDAKMLELVSEPFSTTLQKSWPQLSNAGIW